MRTNVKLNCDFYHLGFSDYSLHLSLFPQRFGRYVLRPSSGVCRTREPSRNRLIGLVGWVFTNGPGNLGSIPGHIIPKTLKWYLIPPCLTLSPEFELGWSYPLPKTIAIKQRGSYTHTHTLTFSLSLCLSLYTYI